MGSDLSRFRDALVGCPTLVIAPHNLLHRGIRETRQRRCSLMDKAGRRLFRMADANFLKSTTPICILPCPAPRATLPGFDLSRKQPTLLNPFLTRTLLNGIFHAIY